MNCDETVKTVLHALCKIALSLQNKLDKDVYEIDKDILVQLKVIQIGSTP